MSFMVAMAVGTGIATMGMLQSGAAQKQAYEFNAQINEADAKASADKAAYDEKVSRENLSKLMGTQRSLYAKAGVDLSSGSPLLVLSETAAKGEEEAMNIRRTGETEVAANLNKAKLNRMYGEQAEKAGMFGAASTFLTGLARSGALGK